MKVVDSVAVEDTEKWHGKERRCSRKGYGAYVKAILSAGVTLSASISYQHEILGNMEECGAFGNLISNASVYPGRRGDSLNWGCATDRVYFRQDRAGALNAVSPRITEVSSG